MIKKKDIIDSWSAYSKYIKNRYRSLRVKKGFGTSIRADLILESLKEYIRRKYGEEVDINLDMSAEEIYNKLFKYLVNEYYTNNNFIETFWKYVSVILRVTGGDAKKYLERFLEERYKCSEY